MKDSLGLKGTAELDTHFGVDPRCRISKAEFLCAPATETNLSAIDTTTHRPITPLPVSGPDAGARICLPGGVPKGRTDRGPGGD